MAKKNKLPIRWRVSEAPAGPYRSFHGRAWPCAHWVNNSQVICAQIECKDDYRPAAAREGSHSELAVRFADHSALPVWTWKRLKARFKTLDEAKAAIEEFLLKHSTCWPADLRPEAPQPQTDTAPASETSL